MQVQKKLEIRRQAQKLVEQNSAGSPSLQRVYLFPSDEEIRIIYVDVDAPPVRANEEIVPFYFSPDPESGIDYPSALALARPEEVGQVNPPNDWGDWKDAEILWEAQLRDAA